MFISKNEIPVNLLLHVTEAIFFFAPSIFFATRMLDHTIQFFSGFIVIKDRASGGHVRRRKKKNGKINK